ncbi:MAG: PAS domain-containing protein [Candidatus Cloacimonetes bacterium]|nr:PAS domain-containing protein [Candidatus Cloacimonadota bacterium]
MEKTQDATNPESELKHLSSEVQGISGALIPNLMHNLPGMAYRCKNDAQWSMVFLSEGSLELTGYAASDLVGNHLLCYDDIIVEEDRDFVRRAIDTAVENRTQFQMEYRIRAKSGTIKWVWEKGNAVYDKHNTPVYLDGFIIDVSARRKAEDDLKKSCAGYDRAECHQGSLLLAIGS